MESITLKDYKLHHQHIDICLFSLQCDIVTYKHFLSNEEIARSERFHFPHHQRRFLVARAMLRFILARYLNISPKNIEFSYNAHGKPAITNYPLLQFNLSHSKEWALLAIGQTTPIGIDLEFFSSRPYLAISHSFFSKKEHQALQQTPSILQPLAFFHIWAQKEAIAKAYGQGLSYQSTLSLPLLPSSAQIVHEHNQSWKIVSWMPNIACCAALCCDPGIDTIQYHTLDPFIVLS